MLFHSIGQVIFGIHFTRYRFLHRCARIISTHHDTDSGSCRSSAERSMERCCAPITTTAASASSRSDDDVDQRSAQRSRTEQLLPQQRRPGKPASQFSFLSLSLFFSGVHLHSWRDSVGSPLPLRATSHILIELGSYRRPLPNLKAKTYSLHNECSASQI